MGVPAYKKGVPLKLSMHFSSTEFDCPCKNPDCNTLVDSELVSKLENLRSLLGIPIKITSGYRCEVYQIYLKNMGYDTATGISQHTLGKAADIKAEGIAGYELANEAAKAGFMAIGTGRQWIHVDLRNDKKRSWSYKY